MLAAVLAMQVHHITAAEHEREEAEGPTAQKAQSAQGRMRDFVLLLTDYWLTRFAARGTG